MYKCFLTKEEFDKKAFSGENYHHLCNVLRSKIDDEFLVGYDNFTYISKITSISKDKVCFEVIDKYNLETEFPFSITIAQGYPKGDKMEFIIQKLVELGCNEIIPVMMERSIVKLDEKKIKSKKERLEKIALEASMQSRRNNLTKVLDIKNLKDVDFSLYDRLIVAYEEDASDCKKNNLKDIIKGIKENERVLFLIGPEGGISPDEYRFLIDKGFISTNLGSRILRTETAPIYILSAINYERG